MSITEDRVSDVTWQKQGNPVSEKGDSGLGKTYSYFPAGSFIYRENITDHIETGDFSLSCFFKLTQGKECVIFDSTFNTGSIVNRENGFRLYVSAAGEITLFFGDPLVTLQSRPITDTEWHWLYLCRIDGKVEVYLDDQRVPVLQGNMSVSIENSMWCVGGYPGSATQESTLDYFRIRLGAASTVEFPPMEKAQYPNIEILDNLKYVYYNAFYHHRINQRGAGSSFVWTLIDGELPTGLTFNETGYITGLPLIEEEQGTYPLTVRIETTNGLFSAEAEIDLIYLTVGQGDDVTRRWSPDTFPHGYLRGTLPNAVIGIEYEKTFTIVETNLLEGTPIEWTVENGSLPKGLSLVGGDSVGAVTLKGIPYEGSLGSHSFTLRGVEYLDFDLTARGRVWELPVTLEVCEYISILNFEGPNGTSDVEDLLDIDWNNDGSAKLTVNWQALGNSSMNFPSIPGAALTTQDSLNALGDGDFVVSMVVYSTESNTARPLFTDISNSSFTEAGIVVGLSNNNTFYVGTVATDEETLDVTYSERNYAADTAYTIVLIRENGELRLEVDGEPWIEGVVYEEELESKEWIIGNDWEMGTGANVAIDEFRAALGLWIPEYPLVETGYSSIVLMTEIEGPFTTPHLLEVPFEIVVGQEQAIWTIDKVHYGESDLQFEDNVLVADLKAGGHSFDVKVNVGNKQLVRTYTFNVWAGEDYGVIERSLYNKQHELGERYGSWYDVNDLSTLFQDTFGTIPAITVGDTVTRINDKWGNNHLTTEVGYNGFRLGFDEATARYYLEPLAANTASDLSRIGVTNLTGPVGHEASVVFLSQVDNPFRPLSQGENAVHFGGFGSPNSNSAIEFSYTATSNGDLKAGIYGNTSLSISGNDGSKLQSSVIRNGYGDKLALDVNGRSTLDSVVTEYVMGNQICLGSHWRGNQGQMKPGERLYMVLYLPYGLTDEEVVEIQEENLLGGGLSLPLEMGIETGKAVDYFIESQIDLPVYSVVSGVLPEGITLSPEGLLSGITYSSFVRERIVIRAENEETSIERGMWLYTYSNAMEEAFQSRAKGGDLKGLWFDFSDTSFMYQDLDGLIPANTVGDEIKLVYDKVNGCRLEKVNNSGEWRLDFNPLTGKHFVRVTGVAKELSHAVSSMEGIGIPRGSPSTLLTRFRHVSGTAEHDWVTGPVYFSQSGDHNYSMEVGLTNGYEDLLKVVSSIQLDDKEDSLTVTSDWQKGPSSSRFVVGTEFNVNGEGSVLLEGTNATTVLNGDRKAVDITEGVMEVGFSYKYQVGSQSGAVYGFLEDIIILPYSLGPEAERTLIGTYFTGGKKLKHEHWTPNDMRVPPNLYLDSRYGLITDNGDVVSWVGLGNVTYSLRVTTGGESPLIGSGEIPSLQSPIGTDGTLADNSPWGRKYLDNVGQMWLLGVSVPVEGERGTPFMINDMNGDEFLGFHFYKEDSANNAGRYVSVASKREETDSLEEKLSYLKDTDLTSVEVATPFHYRLDYVEGSGSGGTFFSTGEDRSIGMIPNLSKGKVQLADSDDGIQVLSGDLKDAFVLIGGSGDNVLPSGTDFAKVEGFIAHEFNLSHLLPKGHQFMASRPYIGTPMINVNPSAMTISVGFVAGRGATDVGIKRNQGEDIGETLLPFITLGSNLFGVYQRGKTLYIDFRLGPFTMIDDISLVDEKGVNLLSKIELVNNQAVIFLEEPLLEEGKTYYIVLSRFQEMTYPQDIAIIGQQFFFRPRGVLGIFPVLSGESLIPEFVFFRPRGVLRIEAIWNGSIV